MVNDHVIAFLAGYGVGAIIVQCILLISWLVRG